MRGDNCSPRSRGQGSAPDRTPVTRHVAARRRTLERARPSSCRRHLGANAWARIPVPPPYAMPAARRSCVATLAKDTGPAPWERSRGDGSKTLDTVSSSRTDGGRGKTPRRRTSPGFRALLTCCCDRPLLQESSILTCRSRAIGWTWHSTLQFDPRGWKTDARVGRDPRK